MKIILIEPYYTGSHKQWADGYKDHSTNEVSILSMKGQFWKWRMHGGAVTMARKFNELNWRPDLILVTDMLDLSTFLALTRKKSEGIPTALYFHENQLSYPWSPKDRDVIEKRDTHYGFINYSSALSADKIFFNSKFHMNSFLDSLKPFLKQFPDHNEIESIDEIHKKSKVLYLGMDLQKFDSNKVEKSDRPLILWNHRWEYDKNPELFFSILEKVKNNGCDFQLAVLGENFSQSPIVFEKARKVFESNIVHWGYAESFDVYAEWLWRADILPVTSNQEFFGGSVMEAIYCDTWPILPNRLTYPELILKKDHTKHIYNNEAELFKKVVWTIKNYKTVRKSKLSKIALQFDWRTSAPIYDKVLSII
jgi:glycosyltransferase involved in cell wall biosynthesis